jgi:nitrate reductase NapAB chaperone NapD
MNLSGVLVITRSHALSSVAQALSTLPGVEVHQQDADSGRLVAVLEAPDIEAETALLRLVQAIPGVALAEMVTHYFPDDEQIVTTLPDALESHPGLSLEALAALNAFPS